LLGHGLLVLSGQILYEDKAECRKRDLRFSEINSPHNACHILSPTFRLVSVDHAIRGTEQRLQDCTRTDANICTAHAGREEGCAKESDRSKTC